MKYLIIVPLMFFFASCGSSKIIREDVGDFDLKQYLVGTGTGDSESSAKQRARSDLAKIFEVEVKEDTLDSSQYKSGAKGVDKNWQINRNIATYTNKILTGVQIASVNKVKETAQYRAVAILSRGQASSTLRQQILTLDGAISRDIASSKSLSGEIESIRTLYKALEKQKQRQQLQKALVVLDNSGKGIPSPTSFVEFSQQLNKKISQLTFTVSSANDYGVNIKSVVQSALANLGAKVSAKGKYKIHAAIKVHDLGLIQGWNWFKALASYQIYAPQRQPLVKKQLAIKVAALDKGSAKLKLQKKLLEETEQTLLNMILGK